MNQRMNSRQVNFYLQPHPQGGWYSHAEKSSPAEGTPSITISSYAKGTYLLPKKTVSPKSDFPEKVISDYGETLRLLSKE